MFDTLYSQDSLSLYDFYYSVFGITHQSQQNSWETWFAGLVYSLMYLVEWKWYIAFSCLCYVVYSNSVEVFICAW